MPSRKIQATAYLSQEEHDEIAASAKRAGLSISTFLKRVALGMEVKSLEKHQAVRELTALKADLGRLGGLLKMWLLNEDENQPQVKKLLRELEQAKAELARKIRAL